MSTIFGTPATGSGGFAGSSGTVVNASAVNTAAGDMIACIFIGSNGGAITSVTDTAGNTYTVSAALDGGSAGFVYYAYVLVALANATNVVKVTFTSNQTTFASSFVWDFPITGGVPAFDTSAFGHGTSTTPTTGSFNTTGSDEVVLVMAGNDVSGFTYTQGTGYTLDSAGFNSGVAGAEHKIFNATQSGITAGFTTSNGDWTIGAVAFNKGATVSGVHNSLMMMGYGN